MSSIEKEPRSLANLGGTTYVHIIILIFASVDLGTWNCHVRKLAWALRLRPSCCLLQPVAFFTWLTPNRRGPGLVFYPFWQIHPATANFI